MYLPLLVETIIKSKINIRKFNRKINLLNIIIYYFLNQ